MSREQYFNNIFTSPELEVGVEDPIRIHIGLIDPWCQANRLSNGFQWLAGTQNKDDQKAPLPPPPGQTDRQDVRRGKTTQDYPPWVVFHPQPRLASPHK